MFNNLKTCTVKSFTAEIVVNTKPVSVNVNDDNISAQVPLADDFSSQLNVTINRKTGKTSVTQSNVESVSAANTLTNTVIGQLKAILTEIDAI